MNYGIIRIIRKSKGLMLKDLASDESLRTSVNRLGDIERGVANPSIKTLEKICDKLDLKVIITTK